MGDKDKFKMVWMFVEFQKEKQLILVFNVKENMNILIKTSQQKRLIRKIEKAKNFKPKLKKLYFATTADKDAKIEEYIREINLKNIKEGGFEIHLYCWGDIVEFIFENRNTYNYYVNSFNFKDNYTAELTFFNDILWNYHPNLRKILLLK